MRRRFSPRTADGREPRPYAELDRGFAAHEFLETSRREARGWEPRRGDSVLVSVRVGVRMRGVFVGQATWSGYGVWAQVILMGRVRSFPRQMLSRFRPGAETVMTPQLERSIRWGFERPA